MTAIEELQIYIGSISITEHEDGIPEGAFASQKLKPLINSALNEVAENAYYQKWINTGKPKEMEQIKEESFEDFALRVTKQNRKEVDDYLNQLPLLK